MRRQLAICALLLLSAAVSAHATRKEADEAEIQSELRNAQQELKEAKQSLASRLPTLREYKAAAQKVALAKENLRAAQNAGVPSEISAAANGKLKAQKELDALARRVEAHDPNLVAATKRVNHLSRKLQNLADAKAKARREVERAAAEREREQRAAIRRSYDEVLSRAAEKNPDVTSVPVQGDETNIALVEANPQKYVDKTFVICGGVRLSNYYNFGYGDAESTHYSLNFRQASAEGNAGPSASLYQRRTMGDDILNVLAKREGEGDDRYRLMRFKVTVSSRYVRSFEDTNAQYEVLDWQFLGRDGKWTAWKSEIGDTRDDRELLPFSPEPIVKKRDRGNAGGKRIKGGG